MGFRSGCPQGRHQSMGTWRGVSLSVVRPEGIAATEPQQRWLEGRGGARMVLGSASSRVQGEGLKPAKQPGGSQGRW